MNWLKRLGISPLGWMIIVAIVIYFLATGPGAFFYNPMPGLSKWVESLK